MARRNTGARLPEGTFLTDFSSPERVRQTLGSAAAIQAEYSRQRSIIRKRVERMAAAGEVYNRLYKTFGNLAEDLPAVKNLTTEQMAKLLGATSRAIAGGYQNTLKEIRSARKEAVSVMRQRAEEEDDSELAAALSKEPTPAQMARIHTIMGMVQRTLGRKMVDSNELLEDATKMVMTSKSKTSLLTLASQVMAAQGYDDMDDLMAMKDHFTAKGTTRVSWAKAHKARGK